MQAHLVQMLGMEGYAGCLQAFFQLGMGVFQPLNRGEQAKGAALASLHQLCHRRGDGLGAFTRNIIDHKNTGLAGILKG